MSALIHQPARHRQVLGAQKFRVEDLAGIAVAIVAEHSDDGLARPEIARHTHRACNVDRARTTEAEAFVFEQVKDVGQGLGIGDTIGQVDLEPFEIGGDPPLADALGDRIAFGLQRAIGVILVERCAFRVGKANLDIWIARAQRLGNARQRTTRTDRGDKPVDPAVGLVPDFGARGFDMRTFVRDIVELVGPHGAFRELAIELFSQPPRNLDVIVGVLVRLRRHFDELRAIKAQCVFLFLALRLGNDDHRLEAKRIGDEREPDAGIARSTLHDRATGFQRTRLDQIMDDEQRCAVFHRLAGIEKLGLAPDFASRQRRNPIEADKRRIADGGNEVVVLGHDRPGSAVA